MASKEPLTEPWVVVPHNCQISVGFDIPAPVGRIVVIKNDNHAGRKAGSNALAKRGCVFVFCAERDIAQRPVAAATTIHWHFGLENSALLLLDGLQVHLLIAISIIGDSGGSVVGEGASL